MQAYRARDPALRYGPCHKVAAKAASVRTDSPGFRRS